jgi:predicted DNA-binding transcriptional regulator AlpA
MTGIPAPLSSPDETSAKPRKHWTPPPPSMSPEERRAAIPKEKLVITLSDICEHLNIGRTALTRLRRARPDFPKPLDMPGDPRWLLGDILAWVETTRS